MRRIYLFIYFLSTTKPIKTRDAYILLLCTVPIYIVYSILYFKHAYRSSRFGTPMCTVMYTHITIVIIIIILCLLHQWLYNIEYNKNIFLRVYVMCVRVARVCSVLSSPRGWRALGPVRTLNLIIMQLPCSPPAGRFNARTHFRG